MTTTPTETPETLGYKLSPNIGDSAGTAASAPLSPSVPPYKGDRGRDTGTAHPAWLAEKIENNRRAARPTNCPRCDQPLLIGPDDDRHSVTARVDAHPVTPLIEAVALLEGRHSCNLIRGDLHHRYPWHTQQPEHPHPIHLEHACPTNPEGRLF